MGLVRMEEHRVRPVRMSPSWPSAPRYAPYDKGRFQFTLGIRELDPAEWIEIDDQYAPQLAEKRRLLAERPGEVSGAVPGSLWAQAECLDMLLDHLARHPPEPNNAGGPDLPGPGTGGVPSHRRRNRVGEGKHVD